MFDRKPQRKYTDRHTALLKMQHYCAYQERCHSEVRTKLIELGCFGEDLEGVIADLISENFLDEERFAQMYAQGKFNIKRWGRIRIRLELKAKKVSEYSIKKALNQWDEVDYFKGIQDCVVKKSRLLAEQDSYLRRQKLFMYALQKGFESDLVHKALNWFEQEWKDDLL